MENELVFVKYEVICKTDGCANSNIPIEVDAPEEGPFVICGVCSLRITDVQLKSSN